MDNELIGMLKRAGYYNEPEKQLRGIVQSHAQLRDDGVPLSYRDKLKMVGVELPTNTTVPPVVWPPNSGEVETTYFPLSEAIAGTIGYGVEKATGSPTAGFLASMMAPSPTSLVKGLARAVRGGGDDARKIFAGVGAKTANLPKRAEAEQMLAAGADPAQVWRDTGWAVGPDKKWRFEIPDNAAKTKLQYAGKSGEVQSSGNLGNGLIHDPLYDAYPNAKQIQASIYEGRQVPEQGSFSNDGPAYHEFFPQLVAQGQSAKSPLLHELQHAVQEMEGFARGGSPESAWIAAADFEEQAGKKLDEMRDFFWSPKGQQMTRKEKDNFIKQMRSTKETADLYSRDSMAAYRALGGEAESRLVQSRLNMTPEQLRAQYPYDPAYFEKATGVKLSDLILRGEGGGAASVARQTAAPFTLGGIADEIPATVPAAATRALDDNALRALRSQATELEDAGRGISMYVTQDGGVIVSRPKGVKTPERLKRFADENGLEYSELQWRQPVTEKNPLFSPPMPKEYRESGAKYHWE